MLGPAPLLIASSSARGDSPDEIRSDGDVSAGLIQELIQKCQEVRANLQSNEGFQRFALRATQKNE